MKLKNDMVNLIVRVEHHLCPLYCGVVDRRRIIAFLLLTISELIIIPYHIMLFLVMKESYGLSLCCLHTFVFCILQFLIWKRKIAFVKGISSLYFLMFAKLALDSVFCINFGLADDNLSVVCNLFVVFILAITALSQALYKTCTIITVGFPFGWGELWGVADRTDYDLTQHIKTSGQKMEYFDPETNEKYVPYVIEPSLGVERLFLAVITEAYDEEQLEDGTTRNVMHFHPYLAPVKAAVLPLSKKLADKAGEIADELSKYFCVDYDDAGAIGKRYRRQDEIGTPFCITYDFDSVEDGCVTVRERDSMKQERMPIADVKKYIEDRIAF